ncbi:hypothetical protein [Nocardia sp. NPDC051570]|uniref:hypothetical protein n=1 Tax=Nocardia sp. NPDC051570 TaxID=3364324 RepID=UPI00378F2AD1
MTIKRRTPVRKLIDALTTAVSDIDGLRPAIPVGLDDAGWLPWSPASFAVELTPTTVEIRVIATALPLTSLAAQVESAIRPLLEATEWAAAVLRLIVVDLDATVFGLEHSKGTVT